MNPIPHSVLTPLGWLMKGLTGLRNRGYDRGLLSSHSVSLPVISVGNLSVGGTGKTPVVIALAEELLAAGKSVAILSRGYGRSGSGTVVVSDGYGKKTVPWETAGDEPALMAGNLPQVPIVVDENRLRGAERIHEQFHPDVLLLDDAFQHRRLRRDLDIVLLNAGDAERTYRLFPAGRLRERWDGLKRAHLILVTKSNLFTLPPSIQSRLNGLSVPFFPVSLVPKDLRPLTSAAAPFDMNRLARKPVLLCSGIGDPPSFTTLAETLKIQIREHLVFRDHYSFNETAVKKIKTHAHRSGAELILTTEKDAVRLESQLPQELPVAALRVGIDLPAEVKIIILKAISGKSADVI
ncbi:MAG: tetraacyldisaccharide 4'-kinase [Fidelibacterota bacterium]